ncbi:MAG: hypothetical protein L3K15_01735 [Thermoplasmata archaeon]|nr:hypothetical protein [Thermoplasmata archaeon]
MSGDALSALSSLFREPTLGLPIALLVIALALWLAWPSSARRAPARRAGGWSPPSTDLVSQTYFALANGEYSRVLEEVDDRFAAAVERGRGQPIDRLPRTRSAGARQGISDAVELRRCHRELIGLRASAISRESRFFVRWAFWRTEADDRSRFLRAIDREIERATSWIRTLENHR